MKTKFKFKIGDRVKTSKYDIFGEVVQVTGWIVVIRVDPKSKDWDTKYRPVDCFWDAADTILLTPMAEALYL